MILVQYDLLDVSKAFPSSHTALAIALANQKLSPSHRQRTANTP